MNDHRRQFLLSLLAYVVHRGVSASELCHASGIDIEALTKSNGGEITRAQQNDFWRNATQFCKDPFFGLHFGESLQLAALGAVGEVIKSSSTVGEAITIAASFTPLVTDLFTMEIESSRKNFSGNLIRTDLPSEEFVLKQVADFLVVFTIHELNGFLLQKVNPIVVRYPHKISDSAEYKRAFRCSPTRAGMKYRVEFDSRYWDQPIITANYELQRLFLEKVSGISHKTESMSLSEKIGDYLKTNAYLGLLSLEDVAANFNMTPRSLQRRLQDESVTFQQLADSVRKSLALYYLQSRKYQLKEISHILGYNELSAFSRAFKRWTGKTPISYQA